MSQLPPECEQLLIAGYVLGNLSPAEAMLLEELVADNPEIIKKIAEVQSTLEIAHTVVETAPPPNLKNKVLEAYAQKNRISTEIEQKSGSLAAATQTKPAKSNAKKSFSLSRFLSAIAIILIALLSYSNYRFWKILQAVNDQNTEQFEIAKRSYTLTSSDASKKAEATLRVNPITLKATLLAKNLPSLPSEKVYALWTVVGKNAPFTTDEKGAILTAVFEPDDLGNINTEIVLPQPHFTGKEIDKIAITIEERSAPQNHQGSIVIATENLN